MSNIIVIDDDPKTSHEITSLLMELDNTNNVRSFKAGEAFLEKYLATESTEERAAAAKDIRKLDYIDIIIFKATAIKDNPRAWVQSTLKVLNEKKLKPLTGHIKFILVRFEDDGIERDQTYHPNIYDMLTLPLDRLLFLQKLEIISSLPEKKVPSYLFSQNIDIDIEISKKAQIEKISEVAVAIKNPIPLKPGVTAHLFFNIPENVPYGGELIDVYAKAIFCEPHPDLRGIFLIYFSFFGLSKDTIIKLRSFLDANRDYSFLKNPDSEAFKFDPRNIFLTDEDKKIRKIAILDSDEAQANILASSLEQEIGNIEIFISTSYFRFSSAHFQSEEELEMVNPAKDADFPPRKVQWSINGETGDLIAPPKGVGASDQILGFSAAQLFAKPEGWQGLFSEEYQKTLLEEALGAINKQNESVTKLECTHKDGRQLLIQLTFQKREDCFLVTIAPPPVSKGERRYHDTLDRVDMIFIDEHLIPEDLEGWLERLEQKILENSLNTTIPKIVIMGKTANGFTPESCAHMKVFGFLDYPSDIRQSIFLCSSGINTIFSRYRLDNIGWAPMDSPVYLAKKAKLEGLSEFGSSLCLPQPLTNGATLYLHRSIYDNAPGGNLCARFYFSEPHPQVKGCYRCYFLYYGITDAFLKFTRNFIREKYALEKAKNE